MLKHNLRDARLVLHADDLGMNRAVTDGILRGFRDGLLTSASLLANAPDAARALDEWKVLVGEQGSGHLPSRAWRESLGDPRLPFDLGVHLNLTQGRPLSRGYPAELLDSEGRFSGVFSLFAKLRHSGDRFRPAILEELTQQVQVVCDHGLRPTHLNGHQYVEMIPAVTTVMLELLERFRIKVVRVAWERSLLRSTLLGGRPWSWPLARVKHAFARRFRARMDSLGVAHADVFFGTAHAGRADLRLLRVFLASARDDRLIEIGLHPGEEAGELPLEHRADGWLDPLAQARPKELEMLLSVELLECVKSSGRRLGRLAEVE